MRVVVDGNDGLGKSTLVAALRQLGYEVSDRGLPTKMTDDPSLAENKDEFYLILDAPVEVSRQRLAQAGKDLNERYHTVEDLTYYRQRFQDVARQLENCAVIDATGDAESVLAACLAVLRKRTAQARQPPATAQEK